jgi:hypothetical protein
MDREDRPSLLAQRKKQDGRSWQSMDGYECAALKSVVDKSGPGGRAASFFIFLFCWGVYLERLVVYLVYLLPRKDCMMGLESS